MALYRGKNVKLEFICGASLISPKSVLTAAHCIQDKGLDAPMSPSDGLLFLGKHNLYDRNELGFQIREIKHFMIHPEWKPNDKKSYDADLCLTEMESAVKFSNLVRPICLWNGPENIENVVGLNGVVTGWGTNEAGKLNPEFPKKVNAKIISDVECLRSHVGFTYLTSARTFCAGGNGENPCKGDSGGGFVLKSGNRWFIRGIVSSGLIRDNSCDVSKATVFTDVAKFMHWIRTNMK